MGAEFGLRRNRLTSCALASTGPRPRGRGIKAVRWQKQVCANLLQRGRARVGAELYTYYGCCVVICYCFNGAAPAWARNFHHPMARLIQYSRFNGAAPAWARNSQGGSPIYTLTVASTGPRPRGRGILLQKYASAAYNDGFNGAAPAWARNCGLVEDTNRAW